MKRTLSLFIVFVFTLSLFIFAADTPATPDSWQSNLVAWREKRAANLQKPEGWLSLIGLEWLKEGDNSVGSASDNKIQIAKAPAHLVVVHLEKGGAMRLLAPAGGFPKDLLLDGHPAQEQPLLSDDNEHSSRLSLGDLTIIIIHRDDRYGLRIKDAQAATRVGFHGLRWYPPNSAYRVHAKWIPYNPPKMIDIPTILGTVSKLPAPGAAEFTVDGKVMRLEPVLEDSQSTELFFILRDTTSKTTTYGAGRFLYTELPDHGLTQPGEPCGHSTSAARRRSFAGCR